MLPYKEEGLSDLATGAPALGGESAGESVGLIIPVSHTSDCDTVGGLLKLWVVEANSQMSR